MLQRVVVLTLCYAAATLASPVINNELNDDWELYKTTYSKHYTSHQEETLRRVIWEENVAYIAKHNREHDLGLHTYTVGINQYADMSTEEFVSQMNGFRMSNKTSSAVHFMPPSNLDIPASIDWRQYGYVTPIKNQGQCGSCWAFSTTGSLEGQHKKSKGQLVSLSEQNLLDCSTQQGNQGCNGGWVDRAFDYIQQNGGIDTEQSYPYTARQGTCRYNPVYRGATVTGHVDIPRGNEAALQQAVASVGPVSVAIDANHRSFQLYRSGVYYEPGCSTYQLDHAVLVIGYSTYYGRDYWLVKNSWGTTWGQQGYIWMSRNQGNQCGIASSASYPLV